MSGMNDGGGRITYGADGAMREPTTGKGRYDLITPFGIRRLAAWYEKGAAKYAPRNWEKGIPYSRCIDSAKRHIDGFLMRDTSEDHLAAARCNLGMIMHYQDAGPNGLDDLPRYRQWGPDSIRERGPLIVAVDFDGCLCQNRWPEIGEPNLPLIRELIERREKLGDKLILWTCREGDKLREAVEWCEVMGLCFDAVNANLPEMTARYGNDCRKIGADEYIDDKARRREYRAEGGSE